MLPILLSLLASSSIHWRLTHCFRLRVGLIPWFCRATEINLRGYWRKRSHHYYYYYKLCMWCREPMCRINWSRGRCGAHFYNGIYLRLSKFLNASYLYLNMKLYIKLLSPILQTRTWDKCIMFYLQQHLLLRKQHKVKLFQLHLSVRQLCCF